MTQRLHLLISIKNYSWADIHLFWPGYDGLAYFPASGPVTCHLSLALAAPAPFISSWRLPHHTILDLCPHLHPLTGMENPILFLFPPIGWLDLYQLTKPAQSIGSPGREQGLKRKRQLDNTVIWPQQLLKLKAGLFFPVCLYIILRT